MRLPKIAVLAATVVLYVAAGLNVFGFWPILNTAFIYFIFYAIGGLYCDLFFAIGIGSKPFHLSLIGITALLLMTAIAVEIGNYPIPIGLISALLGTAGVVCLAKGICDWAAGKFFILLGFFSLEIYLGHTLFSTASRAVLNRCGIHGATPCLISGLLLGIFVSLALAVLCRKLKFPYLFRWPA